jgi:hypothetical protein
MEEGDSTHWSSGDGAGVKRSFAVSYDNHWANNHEDGEFKHKVGARRDHGHN